MWLITKIGFFNIIQYPEDRENEVLTVKARRREDLERFRTRITEHHHSAGRIEESDNVDYSYHMKALAPYIAEVVINLIAEIDYTKTLQHED